MLSLTCAPWPSQCPPPGITVPHRRPPFFRLRSRTPPFRSVLTPKRPEGPFSAPGYLGSPSSISLEIPQGQSWYHRLLCPPGPLSAKA